MVAERSISLSLLNCVAPPKFLSLIAHANKVILASLWLQGLLRPPAAAEHALPSRYVQGILVTENLGVDSSLVDSGDHGNYFPRFTPYELSYASSRLRSRALSVVLARLDCCVKCFQARARPGLGGVWCAKAN